MFAEDNSAKSLLADERMTIGAICRQLAAKNYIQMGLDHCIIEHMPQLYLGKHKFILILLVNSIQANKCKFFTQFI